MSLFRETKRAAFAALKSWLNLWLERGLDFEAPGFQERLWDVFRVLVAAGPLAQAGGAQVLIGGELVFAHNLLKLGDGWDNRANRLGFAPVWISATLGHTTCLSYKRGMNATKPRYLYDSPASVGMHENANSYRHQTLQA